MFYFKGFKLVSVPDILHHSIIVNTHSFPDFCEIVEKNHFLLKESCGFPTKGTRTQIYKLDFKNDYGKYCLSGTAEMALGGLLKNRVFNETELPLKFVV